MGGLSHTSREIESRRPERIQLVMEPRTMKTKLGLALLGSLAAVSLAQAQISTNFVLNPSFEQPGYQVFSGWAGQVPDWSNDNSSQVQDSGVRNDSAPDGSWNAYLFGADSMSGAYPYQTTAHLIQANEIFHLTFDAEPISGSSGAPSYTPLTVPLQLQAEVYYLNGGSRTVLHSDTLSWDLPPGQTTATNGWNSYSFTVDASLTDANSVGKPVGVQFINATTDANGFNWVAVDNVSLTTVPEPDTIALLTVGVVALGMVVFRRRRN